MNASKEQARKAIENLTEILSGVSNDADPTITQKITQVKSFLEAAERKLPKEVSFERAKYPRNNRTKPVKKLVVEPATQAS